MAQLLADQLAQDPSAPAVVDDRGTRTVSELSDRVDRLVHDLRARDVPQGASVVAMLGNQAELVEVSLACIHGGWVLVPVNWHWVPDEIAYVLDDARAAAVVVDDRWREVMGAALAQAGTDVPALVVGEPDDRFSSYDDALVAAPDGEPEEPVKGGPMFYTSGTTGRPKGVRSGLASVGGPPEIFTLMAHSTRELLELPTDARPVQGICGPMYHSAQWVFAHFALLCGATLVLQHRYDAAGLLDLVDRHGITNLHLVPTQMVRLLDLPDDRRSDFDGSSLRAVLHGAAPCPPEVKRRMIDWWGPIITEYYGGTEGGFLSVISAKEWLVRPGSVGRPVPVIEIVVVGEDGERLGPNEPGDLYFRSLLGSDFEYHNAPDKTASAHLEPGLGTLGDVGYLDDDGYLFLSDRKIDMIISGGVNIYPAETEGVLAAHPAVADVAVFGIPDPEMGESVRAALALRSGHAWDDDLEAALVAHCREHLAGYKCPRSFEVHAELPRSDAGKLQKRALRDPHWQSDRAI
jgi:long-chain acyl-CoA synthetase